jgi:hypothetical protein
MRSDIRHAKRDDIWPPFDSPVEKTRLVSRHRSASRRSSSSPMNTRSWFGSVGTATQ